MIRKPRSIRSILFLTYSSIILIGIALLFVLFYLWSSNLLKKEAFNSISELSASLQKQLDLEVQKLDSVSVSILYSNLISDRISEYDLPSTNTDLPYGPEQDLNRLNKSKTDLYDILVALVGPSYPVQQVYLHLFSGVSIGVGFDNSQRRIDLPSQPWFHAVNENKKQKLFRVSVSDTGSLSLKNNVSLSLFRYFSDKYNTPKGIVEVKQSYDKIFGSFIQLKKNNPSLKSVLIYSNSGEIVYPRVPTKQDQQIVDQIQKNSSINNSSDKQTFINDPVTNDKILLTMEHSDLTNWSIAVMISNKSLLSPLNKFTKIAIFVTFIILLFLIILSYYASKKITGPLHSLNKTIKAMSLESLVSGATVELNSGMNEWDRLNASFIKMNSRLKESFEQLLLSRTQELQAKMTALQSQMNPHFLYNSLATISAMAYEKMHDQIILMCDNLSDMMRYIAADDSSLVEMQTEIHYTEMYLTCMKLRYGDMLTCKIDFNTSLQHIHIPKIIIQPLVENALKYGTKTSPPWLISVNGKVVENRWIIEVKDNGHGFDEQELSRFYAQLRHIEQTNVLPALKLQGMGLLNVFIRLKLHFGNQMYFDVRNLPDRGAVVTIGGPLYFKKKEV
ncbi:sensor histidine kinase [Paenibacillus glycinis]|uniref:Signal transduction histidine kinase internal region domain-containing protein n=1 Tax=Paenibacillus glycinis TaxID=2697035 RepID=A0ABW9Y187_9BACL|nr:histidine kinase [Paenibacillus glycinis]NBD28214.1 hypothetical protein [Paenibacillus glycinis]